MPHVLLRYCYLSLNLPSSRQPLQKIPNIEITWNFFNFFWSEGGGEGASGGEEERRFYPSLVSNIVCVHGFLSLSLILKLVLQKGFRQNSLV